MKNIIILGGLKVKKNIKNLFFLTIILCLLAGIIKHPEMSIKSAMEGLSSWINIVFPSLFPFFVISEILIEIGFVKILGNSLQLIMKPLFNVSGEGAFPFVMSIMSGYPMGAKISSSLREKKIITKTEAERIICFSSTSGPLFMLGAVSVGMLKAPSLAPLILYPHYLGAITIGLLLRFYKKNQTPKDNKYKSPLKNSFRYIIDKDYHIGMILGNCVKNSLETIFTVGGFIVFYSVLTELLFASQAFNKLLCIIDYIFPLRINTDLFQGIVAGLLEITTGCNKIASLNIDFIYKVLIINFLIGWSGFSIHSQALSFISKTDIDAKIYIFSKFLHGIFSSSYTWIIYNLKYKNSAEISLIPDSQTFNYLFSSNLVEILIRSTKLSFYIILYMFICSLILMIIGKILSKN